MKITVGRLFPRARRVLSVQNLRLGGPDAQRRVRQYGKGQCPTAAVSVHHKLSLLRLLRLLKRRVRPDLGEKQTKKKKTTENPRQRNFPGHWRPPYRHAKLLLRRAACHVRARARGGRCAVPVGRCAVPASPSRCRGFVTRPARQTNSVCSAIITVTL